jgi:hypothetical protein
MYNANTQYTEVAYWFQMVVKEVAEEAFLVDHEFESEVPLLNESVFD